MNKKNKKNFNFNKNNNEPNERLDKANYIKKWMYKHKYYVNCGDFAMQKAQNFTQKEIFLIIKVYCNYRLQFQDKDKTTCMNNVANLCGISFNSIKRIRREYNIDYDSEESVKSTKDKEKDKYIQNKHQIDEFYKDPIKKFIDERNTKGWPTTCKHIQDFLDEIFELKVHRSTISRALNELGFAYRKINLYEQTMFRKDLIIQTNQYCLKITELMKDDRYQIVYLDESYLYKNHSSNKSWKLKELPSNFKKPSGKGPRLVIIGAITEEGWIKNSVQYWESNASDDFHKNFNKNNFYKYMQNILLPNLEQPSIIVMDNASYHRYHDPDHFNPRTANKDALRSFLEQHQVKLEEKMTRKDLLTLTYEIWDPPNNLLENLACEIGYDYCNLGHLLLYLPPYRPQLNPIELVWAKMKYIVGCNSSYKMKDIKDKLLPQAITQIDASFCKSVCDNAKKCIKQVLDDLKKTFLQENQKESEHEYSDILYSESSEENDSL